MQFDQTGDAEYPFKLVFEGYDELEVIRSAFIEYIARCAKNGQVDLEADEVYNIAAIPEEQQEHALICSSPNNFINLLSVFHRDTAAAMVEIANESGTAAFNNKELILRRSLGLEALKLSRDLKQKAANVMLRPILDGMDEIDIDAEFATLLKTQEPG